MKTVQGAYTDLIQCEFWQKNWVRYQNNSLAHMEVWWANLPFLGDDERYMATYTLKTSLGRYLTGQVWDSSGHLLFCFFRPPHFHYLLAVRVVIAGIAVPRALEAMSVATRVIVATVLTTNTAKAVSPEIQLVSSKQPQAAFPRVLLLPHF